MKRHSRKTLERNTIRKYVSIQVKLDKLVKCKVNRTKMHSVKGEKLTKNYRRNSISFNVFQNKFKTNKKSIINYNRSTRVKLKRVCHTSSRRTCWRFIFLLAVETKF